MQWMPVSEFTSETMIHGTEGARITDAAARLSGFFSGSFPQHPVIGWTRGNEMLCDDPTRQQINLKEGLLRAYASDKVSVPPKRG